MQNKEQCHLDQGLNSMLSQVSDHLQQVLPTLCLNRTIPDEAKDVCITTWSQFPAAAKCSEDDLQTKMFSGHPILNTDLPF